MTKKIFYWLERPYKLFFSFSGRSPRREFYIFISYLFIMVGILSVFTLFMASAAFKLNDPVYLRIAAVILLSFYALNIPPFIALTVRRFHDLGKSGWMVLWLLLPILGAFIIFEYTRRAGNRFDNQYGPDPVPGAITIKEHIINYMNGKKWLFGPVLKFIKP